MTKLHPIAVLLVAGFALPCTSAQADPLEAKECEALRVQQKSLLTPSVQAALSKGPDWVKDNLHNYEQIEQIREYLSVEEKVAFRCRTDGIKIPKPEPPSLPDRKPAVPTYVVAGVAATSLMPVRNPSRDAADAIASVLEASEDQVSEGSEGQGEGDIDNGADTASNADSLADGSISGAAAGIDAAGAAIAKDEAAIRQGLAKP